MALIPQNGRMVPALHPSGEPPNFQVPGGKTPPKRFRKTAPVFLTASGVFQSGGSSSLNQQALVNQTGLPIEVMELRFAILPTAGDTLTGGAFSVQLTYMGEFAMTNSFCPVWSFARSYNMIDEMGLNATNGISHFRLKLARPLWVPPGGFLTADVQNKAQTPNNATLYMGVSCRALLDKEPRPKSVKVPYVSFYASKVFDAWGAADTDASTETDLANPFGGPLKVQRFVHRMNIYDTTNSLNHEYDNGYADLGSNLFQVRMMSSNGEPLVPVFSTVNQVFSRMTRSWEVEHEVMPGGYVLAYLNKLAPPNLSTGLYQAVDYISMIGYREEATP